MNSASQHLNSNRYFVWITWCSKTQNYQKMIDASLSRYTYFVYLKCSYTKWNKYKWNDMILCMRFLLRRSRLVFLYNPRVWDGVREMSLLRSVFSLNWIINIKYRSQPKWSEFLMKFHIVDTWFGSLAFERLSLEGPLVNAVDYVEKVERSCLHLNWDQQKKYGRTFCLD